MERSLLRTAVVASLRIRTGSRHAVGRALCFALLTGAAGGSAATFTWDGGGGNLNWGTGANWTGTPDNTVPGTTDTAVFTNTGLTAGDTVTISAAQSISGLSLNATRSFTLGGTGPLTLGANGLSRSPSSTGTQTIAAPLAIGSGPLVIGSGSGGVTVTGIATGSAGLTKQYGGTLTFTNYTHGITGPISVASGGGTLRMGSSARLQYPTSFTVNGGTLYVDNAGGSGDRIRNDATVHINGGSFFVSGSETIGDAYLDSGLCSVSSGVVNNNTVTVKSVTRAVGATSPLWTVNQYTSILNPPAMTNGILGGWAWSGDWTTVSGTTTGRLGSAAKTTLSGATFTAASVTPASNVSFTMAASGSVLDASATMNTLIFSPLNDGDFSTFNLQGNTLSLTSGGLVHQGGWAHIANGIIRSAGPELFCYLSGSGNRTMYVDAQVVDSAAGPTALVVTGNSNGNFSITNAANTFSGGVYVNGPVTSFAWTVDGALGAVGNKVYINGSATISAPATTRTLVIGAGGASLGSGTFNTANQLQASGAWISKPGDGGVSIGAANPNLSATWNVSRGSLGAYVAGALGSSEVLVNYDGRGGSFDYGASGVTTNPRGVTVYGEGNVSISANLTTSDKITIKALGQINGSDARLATLDYNAGNLVLDEDAIIYKSSGTATGGITNLPSSAKWYFRAGGMPAGLTIGAGTPWKGVSTMALTTGTLNVNSDFYFNTIGASNGNDMIIGNGTNASTLTIAGAGGNRYVGYITNSPGNDAFKGVVLDGGGAAPTANYAGVSKFSVTSGAYLRLSRDNVMGGVSSTLKPSIEVQNGGIVDADSAGAFNSNVSVLSGGALVADVSGGLTGTGAISMNAGGIAWVRTSANALAGSQLNPASFPAGTVVRLEVDNATNINALTNGLVYEMYVNTINDSSRTQTTAGDWHLGGGAMLTADGVGTNRTLNDNAGGQLVIDPGGATLAAATGKNLWISESISAGSNALTIGAPGTVAGLTRTGTVIFYNNALNSFGGTISVTNGATLLAYRNAAGGVLGNAAINLNNGTLYFQDQTNSYAANAVSLSGDGGLTSTDSANGGSGTTSLGTLVIGSNTLTTNSGTGNGSGRVKFTGTTTLTGNPTLNTNQIGSTAGPTSLELAGGITGTGNLTKTGVGGLLVTSNTASFIGNTTVTGGTLQWNYTNATGNIAFGTGAAGARSLVSLSNGGALSIYPVTSLGNMSIEHNLAVGQGGGAFRVTHSISGGTSTVSLPGTVDLGGVLTVYSDNPTNSGVTGPINLDGTITLNQSTPGIRGISAQRSVNLGSGYEAMLNGSIVDGTGSYPRPLVLQATYQAHPVVAGTANTYSSGTIVEACGTDPWGNWTQYVDVAATSKLGTGNVTVNPHGRLRLNAAASIGAGASVTVLGNDLLAGVLRLNHNASPAFISPASTGILALDVTNTTISSMAGLGKMAIGIATNSVNLDSPTLAPATDNVYRFNCIGVVGPNFRVNSVLSDPVAGGTASAIVGSTALNAGGIIKFTKTNTYTGGTTVLGNSTYFGAWVNSGGGSPIGNGPLTLKGATLEFGGQGGVGAGSLSVPLTIAGQPIAYTYLNGATSLNLTFPTINRGPARGTLSVYASSGTLATAAHQIHATGMTNTNNIVTPWLMESNGNFLNNTDDGGTSQGLKVFDNTFANYKTDVNTAGTNDVVTITVAPTLQDSGNTVYAFKSVNVGVNVNSGQTPALTVRSGGMILGDNIFYPNLKFEDGGTPVEGVIHALSGRTAQIYGAITSANGITKTGAGTLYLRGINTFSGPVTVSRGSVNFTDGRQFGNAANSIVLNGGDLQHGTGAGTITIYQGIQSADMGGSISIGDGRSSIWHYGPLTGNGPLFVYGSWFGASQSTLYVQGAAAGNTITGPILARSMTVNLGLVSGLGASDVTLDNGSTLNAYGDGVTGGTLTVQLGSVANFYGANPVVGALEGLGNVNAYDANLTLGGNNASATLYGNLLQGAGTVSITKVGTGTQTLAGASTWTGTTRVLGGTLNITGSMAGNGPSANTAVATDPDQTFGTSDDIKLMRFVPTAGAYAGLGAMQVGGMGNAADIQAGTNSGTAASLLMQWRARTPGTDNVASDVLNLAGMSSAGGYTDPFTLELTSGPGPTVLGWLDSGIWKNAILGNSSTGLSAVAGFTGNWTDFLTANPGAGITLSNYLGSWGVDIPGRRAWAVLNHNSSFAVIPEPAALLVFALGAAALLRRRR